MASGQDATHSMSGVPAGQEPEAPSNGATKVSEAADIQEPAAKRLRTEDPVQETQNTTTGETKQAEDTNGAKESTSHSAGNGHVNGRVNGLAPIKKEYLIDPPNSSTAGSEAINDDAAEGRGSADGQSQPRRDERDRDDRDNDDREKGRGKGKKDKKKNKGQNTDRTFGRFDDAIRLCNSRAFTSEFSPRECKFGDSCRLSHNLRTYLDEGRRNDVEKFDGKCPVFEEHGQCPSGWKCRFVKSHMREVEHEDGKKELVLISNVTKAPAKGDGKANDETDEQHPGVYNVVTMNQKIELNRKRIDFTNSDKYIKWMNDETALNFEFHHRRKEQSPEGIEDLRARFVEPPFKASEKRRLYFGPETPTLAPLTTQGNLPFRRLCVDLGAQVTYSEMAMGMPLLQGAKQDWTLLKAHESELTPPKFTPGKYPVFEGYDNSRDIKFGAQISANQPWIATKSADILSRYIPHLRLIDLNCGCPIDMVFKSGGGSALLESQTKLERMVRGMNAVSGEIPITAKIRTGVKNNRPTAQQVIGRLAFGSREHRTRLGAPGCAALTLHGRSREQRYTKKADWGYIADCAALIKTYNAEKDNLTDTVAEPDESSLPNAKDGQMYFLGNGDCFSHVDYFEHIEEARVNSVMIGRGALIKPWVFEEIEKGQYLDKSSSERLQYVEKFVRYGLDAWGSDEVGIGFTRRFLLEWLSFTHRYVPLGLLEVLPPSLNDRPPAFRGRDELETLMASGNYKDWVKITEMFLGPVHEGFQFQPKHKSNAYEAEG